jgi:hypothetical protein
MRREGTDRVAVNMAVLIAGSEYHNLVFIHVKVVALAPPSGSARQASRMASGR